MRAMFDAAVLSSSWLTGFTVCLSLIASIGAQNLYVLRQAVQGEHVRACVAWCVASASASKPNSGSSQGRQSARWRLNKASSHPPNAGSAAIGVSQPASPAQSRLTSAIAAGSWP